MAVHKVFSFRRFWSLARKEGHQVLRDPSSLLLAFILPLLMIILYGSALNLDADHNRIGLLIETPNDEAHQLAESFRNSPYFDVTTTSDRHTLEKMLIERKIGAYVVVPEDFERNLYGAEGSFAPIQVVTDASETNNANLLKSYIRGAWDNYLMQREIRQGNRFNPHIEVERRIWYNPTATSQFYFIPGSIALILTVVATMLTALVVAREWDRGTFESLLPTPVTVPELIAGKLLPYYFIGLTSTCLCVLLSTQIFSVPFQGSLWLLLVVTTFFLSAALGIGLYLSALSKNQSIAVALAIYTGMLPAQYLSGFVWELSSMPWVLQVASYLAPPRYFLNCLVTLFLAGDVYGLIFKNCLGMACIAAFFAFLNYRKLKKRLD